jgi:DNA-binding protein H-NS
MSNLQDLIAQRDALNKAIDDVYKAELADAIVKAKTIVAEYGLSATDIFGGKTVRTPASKRAVNGGAGKQKVQPKYQDPNTGKVWTGRGRAPVWIDGKDRTKFVISA